MTVITELMQVVQMIAWKKANVGKDKIIRIALMQNSKILKMNRIIIK